MIQKIQFLALSFLFFYFNIFGQGTNLPFGNRAYDILDRMEIKTGARLPYHSSLKPYLRGDAVRFGLDLLENDSTLTNRERSELQYVLDGSNEWIGEKKIIKTTVIGRSAENSLAEKSLGSSFYKKRKPVLKSLYKTPANFFEFNSKDFHFRVNPMLNLFYGNQEGSKEPVFINQRGIEFRGGVDDRVFFYSNIVESQARFSNFVTERVEEEKVVPGQGLYKKYSSELYNIERGYDFLNAQGYLGINFTKHIGAQFGHGKNFIGSGYRSLFLSDYATNYFHLKINWRVSKLHLQNIFSEVAASNKLRGSQLVPKKFIAAHYLSYDVTPDLSIGFFETVVFNRSEQFELQYLNPVIFYRSIEHLVGSPDNVMIGFNGKWNLLKRFQLYGQVIIDEFKADELFGDNQGWWANKYGFQGGLKYPDAFGLSGLDLQAEFNTVRPYTYMHRDSSTNYTHFLQPLAHPSGANFREWIVTAKFSPFKKLFFDAKYFSINRGDDFEGENWGGDLRYSYNSRVQDYGNEIAQGVGAKTRIINLSLSYEIFHNCFARLQYFTRSKDSELDDFSLETTYIGGGFTLNSSFFDLNF